MKFFINLFIVVAINGVLGYNPITYEKLTGRILAEATGKKCEKAGIMCDCDNPKSVYLCIKNGKDFIKEELERCDEDDTCNPTSGTCSALPNYECGVPSHFQCTSDGMFPDPFNCKIYHICVPAKDGTFTDNPGQCTGSYGYNPLTTYCSTELKNKKCTDLPISQCTAIGLPTALKANPAIYYICTKRDKQFEPKLFRCTHGEGYDPADGCKLSGDDEEVTTTEKDATTKPTKPTKSTTKVPPTTSPPEDCNSGDKRADSSYCLRYYECVKGKMELKTCPSGQSFNAQKLACEKGFQNCN